jgi:hypothetical protein
MDDSILLGNFAIHFAPKALLKWNSRRADQFFFLNLPLTVKLQNKTNSLSQWADSFLILSIKHLKFETKEPQLFKATPSLPNCWVSDVLMERASKNQAQSKIATFSLSFSSARPNYNFLWADFFVFYSLHYWKIRLIGQKMIIKDFLT